MEDQTSIELLDKIHALESQVGQLEMRIQQQDNQIQSYRISVAGLPQTNLISPNFLSRAFTVWGHYFVAQLIIAVVVWVVFFCFSYLLLESIF